MPVLTPHPHTSNLPRPRSEHTSSSLFVPNSTATPPRDAATRIEQYPPPTRRYLSLSAA